MLIEDRSRSNDYDAQLAALTIESGGVLYTNDATLARFPGLRWVNPLQDLKKLYTIPRG